MIGEQPKSTFRLRFPRWLRRTGGARPSAVPPGWSLAPHTEDWTLFDIGKGTTAVDIAGCLKGGDPGQERSVIARVRCFDRAGRSLDHQMVGLRMSEAAGKYFYPLEFRVAGEFRFGIALPEGTARLDVALQHWRKGDQTAFFYRDLSVTPVAVVVNARGVLTPRPLGKLEAKIHAAEIEMRDSIRRYAGALLSVSGPLYADDHPVGEAIVEYLVHADGAVDVAERLVTRRLRAGRDREALALMSVIQTPALDKAFGRRQLYAQSSRYAAEVSRSPRIKSRSLVYLLHNCLPYDTGGYAGRAHGLLRGYVKAGWRVHAFARPGYPEDRGHAVRNPQEEIDGVVYHFHPADAGLDGKDQVRYVESFAGWILSVLGKEDVGFVQAASFFHNAFAGRRLADRLGVPLIYEMRGLEWLTRGSSDPRWLGSDQAGMTLDLELRAALGADHVFAITHALRNWLIQQGVPADRVGVLPNGCSPDQFTPSPRDELLAAELNLDNADFVAAYIGSLAAYEGVDTIVSAVARARQLSGLDIRFVIVGDGLMMLSVRERIRDLGAANYVTIAGRVPHEEVPRYYSLADALILARHDTPLCRMISPLKPLEALAMGKFVISTDVAAITEVLTESGGGAVAPAGSVDALAHAIIAAAKGKDRLREIGEHSRRWASSERDWSVLASRALDEIWDRFETSADLSAARPSLRKPRSRSAGRSVRQG